MIDVANRKAVVPHIARGEIRPALRKDRTQPKGARRRNQHPTGLVGGPHAAKTQVDGRGTAREKIFNGLWQRRRIGEQPGPGLLGE